MHRLSKLFLDKINILALSDMHSSGPFKLCSRQQCPLPTAPRGPQNLRSLRTSQPTVSLQSHHSLQLHPCIRQRTAAVSRFQFSLKTNSDRIMLCKCSEHYAIRKDALKQDNNRQQRMRHPRLQTRMRPPRRLKALSGARASAAPAVMMKRLWAGMRLSARRAPLGKKSVVARMSNCQHQTGDFKTIRNKQQLLSLVDEINTKNCYIANCGIEYSNSK